MKNAILRKSVLAPLFAMAAFTAFADADGWRDVFAADLSNADYDPAIWHRDAEGCLTAEKDVAIWTKADYGRFELSCEYNLEPAANSGVILYCSDTKNWIPNAVEIQLLDDDAPKWKGINPRQANASFFGHQAATSNPAKPAGEWNLLGITADGPMLTVTLNGVKVNECDLSKWTDAKKMPDGAAIPPWLSRAWSDLAHIGRIGFQGRHAGAGVRFRNVRIRPLKTNRTLGRAVCPHTAADSAPDALTIVSYNIRIGCGYDDPFRLPKGSLGHLPQCAEVIKAFAPDFVGLQEVDRCSARVGEVDQTAEMARLCGMQGVWVEKIPKYGVSLLSREMPFCVEKTLMKGSTHTRALLVAEFADCFVANTHFPLSEQTCTEAAATVRRVLASKAALKPVFLMGDFNSRPDTPAVKALKEDFIPLSDETKFTWPAKKPDRTIDYIFVDKAHARLFKVSSRSVEAHPEATDHCVLSVRLERNVVDFPVKEKAGEAIQAAIDAAAAAGGGRVTVPAGEYPTKSLRLRSRVELRLEKGANVVGGKVSEDYFTFPDEICSIKPEKSSKVFIYAWDAEDIAITGEGTVNGNGPCFFDQNNVRGRFWAKPPCERPRLVQFVRCRGVRLDGVTFVDCPNWTMLIRLCEDVEVDAVKIRNEQRMINSDGIDFDGCRRVRVSNCDFRTGDDCIIMRAMREVGKNEPVVCEDVVVSDCVFDSACQVIRMGCPSDDTIRNVRFRNIRGKGWNCIYFNYPRRYLRKNDNGYMDISDIVFDGVTGDYQGSAVQIDVEDGIKLRGVKDITFRNFDVKSAKPLRFVPGSLNKFENVRFENVTVNGERRPDGDVMK